MKKVIFELYILFTANFCLTAQASRN
ncbi:uncharacterized protein METZ01_LOCUS43121 [marine metagenome]|uniref:Uncharacterized protein n=1 Tax=marine metagenome TaxID=408172 RepID=A0A381RK32_9ZZZZ